MSAHLARFITMHNDEMKKAVEEALQNFDFVAQIREAATKEAWRVTQDLARGCVQRAMETAEIRTLLDEAANKTVLKVVRDALTRELKR